MPGPVSDSYDPEFGTGSNAEDVKFAMEAVVNRIGKKIGSELKNIVEIAQGPVGKRESFDLSEAELRVIRFSINRALETI
jgi:hypothetical protein